MNNKEILVGPYQELAQRTSASPSPELMDRLLHPGAISLLHRILHEFSTIGQELDLLKKHIFYGKGSQINTTGLHLSDDQKKLLVNESGRRVKIFHGIIGILTEAGELADALLAFIENDEDFDFTNLTEEGGDHLWYLAELFEGIGTTFNEAGSRNIAKLVARYGEKFSEFSALNRDLDKERLALEGK